MVIYDENMNLIENPDLSRGFLEERVRIKEDAEPIDGETKFVWADDDYETYYVYKLNDSPFLIEKKIADLTHKLNETDYVACKALDSIVSCDNVVDFLSTLKRIREEYFDTFSIRADMRKQINELRASIGQE